MEVKVREFWRILFEHDLSGVVPAGNWCNAVMDSPDPNLAIERIAAKARRIGKHRIRNIRMQHVRETVLDEGPVRIHMESEVRDAT